MSQKIAPDLSIQLDSSGEGRSLLFRNPVECIRARGRAECLAALAVLDEHRRAGFYVAGSMDYECLSDSRPGTLDFGVFESVETRAPATDAGPRSRPSVPSSQDYRLRLLPQSIADEGPQFIAAVARIKERLAAGDCYQINYTRRSEYEFQGDVLTLYHLLRALQPTDYGALIRRGDAWLVSLSPELFLRTDSEGRIEVRPIKGTIGRGAGELEDQERQAFLQQDPKGRAENVMIVDLLRNDLGRVCVPGSVQTPRLFEIESYPTLFQMHSRVVGQLQGPARLNRIMPALFPSGSVTGAPKLAAQAIIEELESDRRGAYTGAIGYAAPLQGGQGEAVFNVAIRTLERRENGRVFFGSGCGIVWDSDARAELGEHRLKRSFLTAACSDFGLIETMRVFADGTVWFLRGHIRRLAHSAERFLIPLSIARFLQALREQIQAGRRSHSGDLKLRVVLGRDASLEWRAAPLGAPVAHGFSSQGLTVAVSAEHVYSGDPFRRVKSRERAEYDAGYARSQARGIHDELFCNERRELVESSTANLLVLNGAGEWLTPARDCGALPGVWLGGVRSRRIREAKIYLQDLTAAKAVFLCNSVRGLQRIARIEGDDGRVLFGG